MNNSNLIEEAETASGQLHAAAFGEEIQRQGGDGENED
jgi:hypothetical protein